MARLITFLLLAFLVESLVEALFPKSRKLREYKKYAALVVGELFAFGFGVDIFASLFGLIGVHPFVGIFATGLVIGRGSNFVHDVHDRYIGDGGRSRY